MGMEMLQSCILKLFEFNEEHICHVRIGLIKPKRDSFNNVLMQSNKKYILGTS